MVSLLTFASRTFKCSTSSAAPPSAPVFSERSVLARFPVKPVLNKILIFYSGAQNSKHKLNNLKSLKTFTNLISHTIYSQKK